MDNDKMIDDIVAMLDAGVAKGQGHINVKVEDKNATEKEIVNGTCFYLHFIIRMWKGNRTKYFKKIKRKSGRYASISSNRRFVYL